MPDQDFPALATAAHDATQVLLRWQQDRHDLNPIFSTAAFMLAAATIIANQAPDDATLQRGIFHLTNILRRHANACFERSALQERTTTLQ